MVNRIRTFVGRQRNLILLFISGVLLQVLVNLISDWLQVTLGPTPGQTLHLILSLLIVIGILALAVHLLGRPRPMVIVPPEDRPPRFPGLIALVGPGRPGTDPLDQAARVALEHHLRDEGPGEKLRVAWLVTSVGPGADVAEQFRQRYRDRCQVRVRAVQNAFDLYEIYALVRRIYLEEVPQAGLRPEEVVTDITGGTSIMSVGAALACQDRWPMEYVLGRPGRMESAPILLRWRPEEG